MTTLAFGLASQAQAKNPIAADIIVFGINSGDFLFYFDNGTLCVLIRIASMSTHNIPSC